MSGLFSGANYEPLERVQRQARMRAHDIICIHTMVGSLRGTDKYFKADGWGGTESHFGTGYDGEIIQWQDCGWTADANLNGNRHVISIENADLGTGFPKWNTKDGGAVPAFTDAQIEANARIIAWACREYDIPCELIPDSKPGRRGIGYHRQGVPGHMVADGEKWSNAPGKVCPGDRRIAQIPAIIRRARVIMGQSKETGDMSAEFESAVREMFAGMPASGLAQQLVADHDYRVHHSAPADNAFGQILSVRKELHERMDELAAKLDRLLAAHLAEAETTKATS